MDEASSAQEALVVLTVGGGFIGFGTLVWAISSWVQTNSRAHQAISDVLEEMRQVTNSLDDIMKHPDETSFSVVPIQGEIQKLSDDIKALERLLHEHLKKMP